MDVSAVAALVDERLAAFRTQHDIPGVAYGVLKDGELVHASGVGPRRRTGAGTGRHLPHRVDDQVVHRVGRAAAAGPWSAAARRPARDLPPVGRRSHRLGGGPTIRICDLLAMNAGFPTDDPWGDRNETSRSRRSTRWSPTASRSRGRRVPASSTPTSAMRSSAGSSPSRAASATSTWCAASCSTRSACRPRATTRRRPRRPARPGLRLDGRRPGGRAAHGARSLQPDGRVAQQRP